MLKEGWTYLASVMDLCSRKIIGYAYGTSMAAELAVEAVKNACLNARDTQGIILHSDLGKSVHKPGIWELSGQPWNDPFIQP